MDELNKKKMYICKYAWRTADFLKPFDLLSYFRINKQSL